MGSSKIIGSFQNISGKADSVLTTKADLATYSTERIRLGVGDNDQVLTADSSEATGLKWASASSGVQLDEANTWTANQTFNVFIPCNTTELTISSGAVTVNRKSHIIDTEGDASSDNLDTIGATTVGNTIEFGSAVATRDVTILDNAGDVITAGNFTLDSLQDTFCAIVRHGGGAWLETSRSNNT